MAATRALTITDVYDRFVKGKKVKVEDWDYKVIPENLTALKEKYNIKIDPNTIIPEDKELINNLFQAGLEMLPDTTARTSAASCTSPRRKSGRESRRPPPS